MLTICGSIGPNLSSLTDACLNLGQVQKILFTRKYSTGSTLNKFTIATGNPNILASWTPLTTASDGTKVSVSPVIANPANEPGGTIEYGSGNEVPGGVPILMGFEPGKFTCRLNHKAASVEEAFKTLVGENLTAYLVTEAGKIYGITDDNTTPTVVYGIDIDQYKFSDRILGGRNEPDYHTLEFWLPYGWAEKLFEISPTDFDALTDLSN
jgi:hypothetical protein